MKRILLVDDERNFLQSIKALLEDEGEVRVSLAHSGREALVVLQSVAVDLLITDLKMPEMGGLELLAYMARYHPQTPVIVMTAYTTAETEENLRILGVSHLLEKPVDLDKLIEKINTTLKRQIKARPLSDSAYNFYENSIGRLAAMVELRDPYIDGHQKRAARLAVEIGREMGFSETRLLGLKHAAQVHDIGKIAVPGHILAKTGSLDSAEVLIIRHHPQVGHDLLKPLGFPWPVAEIVAQHHERIDGSGYPAGLAGEEILIEAAVLAVADSVEAIINHRPYRPARGLDMALQEIKDSKNTWYHPQAVDACTSLFKQKGHQMDAD